MKTKRRRKQKGGDFIYLDGVKNETNVWSHVLVPPFPPGFNVKGRILEIYKAITNKGWLTGGCSFSKERVDMILRDAENPNLDLTNHLIEMQLYLCACKLKWFNKGFTLDLAGKGLYNIIH